MVTTSATSHAAPAGDDDDAHAAHLDLGRHGGRLRDGAIQVLAQVPEAHDAETTTLHSRDLQRVETSTRQRVQTSREKGKGRRTRERFHRFEAMADASEATHATVSGAVLLLSWRHVC
jgi:hypothetical protein